MANSSNNQFSQLAASAVGLLYISLVIPLAKIV